jgi:hypothetical protein
MSLEEAFQEVSGVGPARAEELVEIVESEDVDSIVAENVEQAYDYYQNGDYSYSGKFLERAVNNL